jgi:hypothetical protein
MRMLRNCNSDLLQLIMQVTRNYHANASQLIILPLAQFAEPIITCRNAAHRCDVDNNVALASDSD